MTESVLSLPQGHTDFLVGLAIGVAVGVAVRSPTAKRLYTVSRGVATATLPRKMVIVVRSDLPMSAGKIASQCAHAAVTCVSKSKTEDHGAWLSQGQPKIVLRSGPNGEASLMNLYHSASKHGIAVGLVRDAGKTEVKTGTYTALGIGPAPSVHIDKITGHLKTL